MEEFRKDLGKSIFILLKEFVYDFKILTSSCHLIFSFSCTPGPPWASRASWIRWSPWPPWHIPHAPSELSSGLWNGLMGSPGDLCCITKNQKVRKAVEEYLETINPKGLVFGVGIWGRIK